MHRRPLFLVVLLLAATPGAGAATASTQTLIQDPAGDVQRTDGPLAVQPPPMGGVDLRDVTASQAAVAHPDSLELALATQADRAATAQYVLTFNIVRGPTSLPFSTASGRAYTLTVQGAGASGIDGVTLTSQSGAPLGLRIPLASIGAVGGDTLRNLTVTASETDDGGTAAVPQDDTTGTDRAPDAGVGATYAFARPPVAANLTARIVGGAAELDNGTLLFSGTSLRVATPPRSLRIDLDITNHGLDADEVTATAEAQGAGPGGAAPAPVRQTLQVGPGATARLSAGLDGSVAGGVVVRVTSALGAATDLPFPVEVAAAPPPAAREVVPAGLDFLTPLAARLGLDGPLGSYAELGLLLLALLALVTVLFLLLVLTRSPWVRAHAEPAHTSAAPGGVAEVGVRLDRVRRNVARVRAVLAETGPWGARLVGHDGSEGPLELGPKGEARLRVNVPHDAVPKERETVEVDLVPIDADGTEHPERAGHARVVVQAAVPSTPLGPGYSVAGIQLVGVRHDPTQPAPGGSVTTTATVRNGGASPAALRVVLLVERQVRAERRIVVPARSSQDASLDWTAGAGANQVKVQVFLA